MARGCFRAGIGLSALALLTLATTAQAVFPGAFPLRQILTADKQVPHVFVAKVEKVYPDKPAMMLTVQESLKGKYPHDKMPVSLKVEGDKKKAEVEQLLKRVEEGLPLVVFYYVPTKKIEAICVTNGTWFRLYGTEEDGKIKWEFVNLEPALHQTYHKSTEELRQVIVDFVKDKKAPPDVDTKAKPGIGPELKPKEKDKTQGRLSTSGPVFAVIPTVAIGGPLAILALLFPAVFGGALIVLRRWQIFLCTFGVLSTLWSLQVWYGVTIQDHWRMSSAALWLTMGVAALVGAVLAWRNGRKFASSGEPIEAPRKGELIVLVVLSVLGFGLFGFLVVGYGVQMLKMSPWSDFVVLFAALWLGTLYALYLRMTATHQVPVAEGDKTTEEAAPAPPAAPLLVTKWRLPPEAVVLTALAIGCGIYWFNTSETNAGMVNVEPLPSSGGTVWLLPNPARNGVSTQGFAPKVRGVVWKFEAADAGGIFSSPLVTEDRVYVGALHSAGFSNAGKMYCLDRATGKQVWAFPSKDGEDMRPGFSSPCLADGKLYFGEGMHQDANCKLFCLKADTGEKVWEFQTTSHTESSPCVADGKVYFGAGDDGLYCIDAASGKKVWHFQGLHIDCNPCVVGDRIYAASGVGDVHTVTEIFCLDARTGNPLWRSAVELPVWGSPTCMGGLVYFGLGNGNFIEDAEKPAGALLCVRASDGQRVWRSDVPNGVLSQPAVDAENVYFTSRDGHIYCADRLEGKTRWRKNLGSPILASPLLGPTVGWEAGRRPIYAIASKADPKDPAKQNQLFCLDAASGDVLWSFNLQAVAQKQPHLLSSPAMAVALTPAGQRRFLYFGAELDNLITKTAAVYCLEEQP